MIIHYYFRKAKEGEGRGGKRKNHSTSVGETKSNDFIFEEKEKQKTIRRNVHKENNKGDLSEWGAITYIDLTTRHTLFAHHYSNCRVTSKQRIKFLQIKKGDLCCFLSFTPTFTTFKKIEKSYIRKRERNVPLKYFLNKHRKKFENLLKSGKQTTITKKQMK